MMARSENKSDQSARRAWIWTLALSVLLLGGLISQQYYTYDNRSKSLVMQLEMARHELSKLQAADKARLELRQELTGKDKVIARLREKVPNEMAVSAFMESFREWAAQSHVKVGDFSFNEQDRELFKQSEITLNLIGSKNDIANLARRRNQLARLITWGKPRFSGNGAELNINIYSVLHHTERMRQPHPNPPPSFRCKKLQKGVWLPPFVYWLREQKRELREVCTEIDAMGPTRREYEILRSFREEFERLSRIIEKLAAQSE
jgi:Tfp pilus assembly protein PilO